MQRERFGSRLGFIPLSAGCAIGRGNVWKLPWIAGRYGGRVFVLLYFIFLVILGVPVLTMEFAMGRASRKSPIDLYEPLEPKDTKWHLHGYGMIARIYLLMMFYTTVAGWMAKYFVSTVSGEFIGLNKTHIGDKFNAMLQNPY